MAENDQQQQPMDAAQGAQQAPIIPPGVNAPAPQNQAANLPNPGSEVDSGFFQEDNGTYSSMRLMCFVSLLAAILFGFLTIQLKPENQNGIYITFGFLLGAFAPKAVQKFAEQKILTKG